MAQITNGAAELTWHDINTEHKDAKLAKLRQAHTDAAQAARKAREAYEEALESALYASKAVMDTHEILFTHKFGKLRYASRVKGVAPKAAKASPGALTL